METKLVNKITEQKVGENNAIKEYYNLVSKAGQIAKLRPQKTELVY